MQISELRKRLKRLPMDESDILPLAFVGLVFGEIILAIGLLWVGHSVAEIAKKPAPTLVQRVDGQAFAVRDADRNYREPEVIRQLIHEWVAFTYTWSGKLPSVNTKDKKQSLADEGIQVKNKRIPTVAWQASFLLASDSKSNFREAFLERLTQIPSIDAVFSGSTKTVMVIQHVSDPQLLAGETGRWQVDVIANLIFFDRANPSGNTIPWNNSYIVRAVDPPQTPLPDKTSDYQQIIYQLRQRGLEIENIVPLQERKP
jgi:hypothetical protein